MSSSLYTVHSATTLPPAKRQSVMPPTTKRRPVAGLMGVGRQDSNARVDRLDGGAQGAQFSAAWKCRTGSWRGACPVMLSWRLAP